MFYPRKNVVTYRLDDNEFYKAKAIAEIVTAKHDLVQARGSKNLSEFTRRCLLYGMKFPDRVMGVQIERTPKSRKTRGNIIANNNADK